MPALREREAADSGEARVSDWSADYADREIISTPANKRAKPGDMPRHSKGRALDGPIKRPVLWNAEASQDFDPPGVWGMFPAGFLSLALRHLGCPPSEVLHVCSGGLSRDLVRGGIRVDISSIAKPDVQADGTALPFIDGCFSATLIDPPYSLEYSSGLYGQKYPRPSALLREACRVTRPCGRVGFVHYLVPTPVPGLHLLRIIGLTVGCGYRIRAFAIFERDQDELPILRRTP